MSEAHGTARVRYTNLPLGVGCRGEDDAAGHFGSWLGGLLQALLDNTGCKMQYKSRTGVAAEWKNGAAGGYLILYLFSGARLNT